MKGETITGIVLIFILGYYGQLFSRKVWTLHQRSRIENALSANNRELIFKSEAGIDISGKPIYPLPPPEAERTVIFLLRGASLRSDLEFWSKVESVTPKGAGLRLVAYCDGNTCVDLVKKSAQLPDFPVIAYGEVHGSQALITADTQGYSFVRSERWFKPKRVSWRGPGNTPSTVVYEALQ